MSRPRTPALLAITGCVLATACLPGLAPPPNAPLRSGLEIPERPAAPGIAAGPLRIVFASPEGEAAEDAAVTLVFNKPMRALGIASNDRDAPATIAPVVPGKWRWIGSLALRFEPDAPLPGATMFRVEVPAGTRSLDGSQLAEARVLAFATPRPALRASDPKDGARRVEATKPLRLWFNQPIADAEIARVVTITAGTSRVALPFTITRHEGLAVDLAPWGATTCSAASPSPPSPAPPPRGVRSRRRSTTRDRGATPRSKISLERRISGAHFSFARPATRAPAPPRGSTRARSRSPISR